MFVSFDGLLFVMRFISKWLFERWLYVVVMCVVSVGVISFGCIVIRKCRCFVIGIRFVVMIYGFLYEWLVGISMFL